MALEAPAGGSLEQAEGGTPTPSTPAAPSSDTGPGNATPGEPAAAGQDEASAISLLGKERYESVKSDPVKLSKALHQSYTQRMQQLSQHADFLRGWQEDPEAVIQKMAEQYGFQVQKKPGAVEQITDEVTAELSDALGADVAGKIGSLVQRVVEKAVNDRVAPIEETTAQIDQQAALAEANAITERFTAKYPGWEQYDAAMQELGNKLNPVGMDPFEYMEHLYTLVKGKTDVADQAGRAVDRMNTSAKAGDKPPGGVNPDRVAQVPAGKKIKFEEAWAAAKRGIVWNPADVRASKAAARAASRK